MTLVLSLCSHQGMLRRVTAICFITLFIGIMTVVMFAIMNYSEVNLKWEEFRSINLTSTSYRKWSLPAFLVQKFFILFSLSCISCPELRKSSL